MCTRCPAGRFAIATAADCTDCAAGRASVDNGMGYEPKGQGECQLGSLTMPPVYYEANHATAGMCEGACNDWDDCVAYAWGDTGSSPSDPSRECRVYSSHYHATEPARLPIPATLWNNESHWRRNSIPTAEDLLRLKEQAINAVDALEGSLYSNLTTPEMVSYLGGAANDAGMKYDEAKRLIHMLAVQHGVAPIDQFHFKTMLHDVHGNVPNGRRRLSESVKKGLVTTTTTTTTTSAPMPASTALEALQWHTEPAMFGWKYKDTNEPMRCFKKDSKGKSCTMCTAGRYAETGKATCNLCLAGQFAAETERTSCTKCSAGQYAVFGSTKCTACAAGRFGLDVGQGYALVGGGVCVGSGDQSVCNFRTSTDRSKCVAACNSWAGCQAYSWGNEECIVYVADSCSREPPVKLGMEWTRSSSNGKLVSVTSVITDSTHKCFKKDSTLACSTCAPGTYSAAGSSACTKCAAGKHSEGAGTVCTACARGSYAPVAGSSACTACAQGTFADKSGATACIACKAHMYTDKTSACEYCAAGKWMNGYASETMPDCLGCSVDRTQSEHKCPYGKYHGAGDASCACTSCVAGRYAEKSNTVGECIGCATGRYQTMQESHTCDFCESGKKSSVVAATSQSTCTECTFNTFAGLGADMCSQCPTARTACPTGKYRDSTDIKCDCTSCPAGKFGDEDRATSCKECEAGTSSSPEAQRCTTCEQGKFAGPKSSFCTSCPAGQFNQSPKAASCTNCSKGKYQTATGATSCTTCVGGTYAVAGASSCLPCSAVEAAVQTDYATCQILAPVASAGRDYAAQVSKNVLDLVEPVFDVGHVQSLAGAQRALDQCQNVRQDAMTIGEESSKGLTDQSESTEAEFKRLKQKHADALKRAEAEEKRDAQVKLQSALDTLQRQQATSTTIRKAEEAKSYDTAVVKAKADATKSADEARTAAVQAKELERQVALKKVEDDLEARTGIPPGKIELDIDDNGVADVQDAVSLFVAQTMEGYGSSEMLHHYRETHQQHTHAPGRTVDDLLAAVRLALNPPPATD
jgi:hypothetical protein